MFKSLITLTSSNSELRKDFLDRKKVLKSLEANSLIYRGNVVLPAQDDVHRPQTRGWQVSKNKITRFCMIFFIFRRPWLGIELGGVPKNLR